MICTDVIGKTIARQPWTRAAMASWQQESDALRKAFYYPYTCASAVAAHSNVRVQSNIFLPNAICC